MISVAEIRKKAEKLYPEVLKAALTGEAFFPRSIRADKRTSLDFTQMSQEIAALMAQSKDRKGYGYAVHYQSVKTRRHGYQDLPSDIVFECLGDYLKFLRKEKEYALFLENSARIEAQNPCLRDWLTQNVLSVVVNAGIWEDLLKVCNWFMHHFEANTYYIRELPIAVHTKFIEENKLILKNLLEMLIPEKLDLTEASFEKRFRLKFPQPVIRYRSGRNVTQEMGYRDVAVPLDQFAETPLNCRGVFVVENLMNFLTFPLGDDDIAVWGKGFAIENLKEVGWLTPKPLFCWFDLDAQGFQMLSQLRGYFPQSASFLMNIQTLELFMAFAVRGTPSQVEVLSNLSPAEHQLFELLKKDTLRLEQERIPQWYVVEKVREMMTSQVD